MNNNEVHALSSHLTLRTTHPTHYPSREQGNANVRIAEGVSFGELLRDGLESVNQTQQNHEALAAEAIINPDQVDIHDVTIAATQADLSIRLARNIIDRMLTAYREITSLR